MSQDNHWRTGACSHDGWRGYQSVTPTPDGRSVLFVGSVAPEAAEPHFTILGVDLSGDTTLSLSVAYEPRRVSRREAEWLRDNFAAWHAGDFNPPGSSRYRTFSEGTRERARALARASLSLPEYHPPVREIVAGHDGTIWVLRELAWPELVDRWDVFDGDGRSIGSLRVSTGKYAFEPWAPRMKLLRATRAEVWATTWGEFDEAYLHRFRVQGGC